VTVSTLLTTVDEPGALEAYLYVPASRAKELRLGLPVKLLDESGSSAGGDGGHVYFIEVDPDTQTVTGQGGRGQRERRTCALPSRLRARITWGNREGPVVPVLAVQRITDSSLRLWP